MSELRVDEIEIKNLSNLQNDNLVGVDELTGAVSLSGTVEGVNKTSNSWTTNTRPPSPSTGVFGYNDTLGFVEIYNGNEWQPMLEKGVVNKGLLIHLDSADPDSYQEGMSDWFDLGRFGVNFTGNASRINAENGITSGSTWVTRAVSQEAPLDNDYHSIFFTLRFNSSSSFPNGFTGSWNKIFEHTGNSGDRSPGIWRFPSQRRIHWRYNPSNTGVDFGKNSAGNDFDINTWYHIGQTKTGAAIKAYVNGVEVASGNVSNPKLAGNTQIRLVPGYPADILNMNDVMIYNRPLTQAEVIQNFNNIRQKYNI